ncbi:hypothetical protein [Nocardia miyunensis]|uniref:hypothetical protein n=1 Tax=Nocardia miyunensis TaxID=282684 RepID=UPI00082A529F|nr:hypothetical protein [Nocardia miyunensis]
MNSPKMVAYLLIPVVFAAGAAAALASCTSLNQDTHANCLVLSRDRLIEKGTSGQKRVTTSCGTFAVEDNITSGFNSYDVFMSLEPGHRYDIRTGGYRLGPLSSFPTVIKVTPR